MVSAFGDVMQVYEINWNKIKNMWKVIIVQKTKCGHREHACFNQASIILKAEQKHDGSNQQIGKKFKNK